MKRYNLFKLEFLSINDMFGLFILKIENPTHVFSEYASIPAANPTKLFLSFNKKFSFV